MERRGLVRREECATDSRGAEVVLTDAGATAFGNATRPHLRAVRELFVHPLGEDDLKATERITAALREGLRAGSAVSADRAG